MNNPNGQRSRVVNRIIYLIFLTLFTFALWANYANLDEVVRGAGKVVPSSKTQVIQSLEGGILAELLVWEGKEVEAGEIIARLDDRKSKGAYEEIENKVLALQVRLIRLEKLLNHSTRLNLPNSICGKAEDVCASEKHLFQKIKSEYFSAKASMQEMIQLQQKEVALKANMASKQLIPEIDYINANKTLSQVKSELSNHNNEYQRRLSEEHANTLAEINQLRAALDVRKDQLTRTALKAPVKGIVNKILITTIGGVAPPGEPILELTPLDDELRIEAKISPRDVAFVYPNMPATVKLTAYDYSIYGTLSGRVMHVSADTFEDPNQREPKPYYKVFIEVTDEGVSAFNKDVEIRPGMIAEAELHTGQKTVMQYLLKPLFKTKEAFRER